MEVHSSKSADADDNYESTIQKLGLGLFYKAWYTATAVNSLLHLCEEDQLSLLEVIKDYFHVPLEGDLSSCEDESDEDVEGL